MRRLLPLILASLSLSISVSCKASYPTGATATPGIVRLEVQFPSPTPDPRIGRTLSLVAYTIDADGVWSDVTQGTTWFASDSSVIRVLSTPGSLLAVGQGSTSIVASYGGLTASMPITALTDFPSYPQLEFVSLGGQFVAPGGSAGASVNRRDNAAGAGPNVTGQATWTSSNPDVATVRVFNSAAAGFDAHAPGTTRITASLDGRSVSLGFSVGPRR